MEIFEIFTDKFDKICVKSVYENCKTLMRENLKT